MDPEIVDVNEASRTYHFKSGNSLTFEDVIAIELVEAGRCHSIYLGDGSRSTITGEYDAISIEEYDGTF